MKKSILFFSMIVTALVGYSQAPVIEYQLVTSGLSEPVDIAHAGDGSNRLFVVQRGGLIRIWNGSNLLATPFLNVTGLLSLSGSERGLLSMAFHPNYASNRYFFIYYTASNGALTVARYRTLAGDPNVADAGSGVVLLSIAHSSNSNHNGAKLNFGADGFLYLGTGDGGGSNDVPNNAQTGTVLLGKMLRIDVNDFADVTPPLYSIPAGNPYIGNAGVLDEIIALGVRNPWRWSFDRTTGDMWIGDVGQNAREEVDFRSKETILTPTNYGWRCLEGSITNPSATAACPPPPNNVYPIFDYPHNADGGYVITGGYVYRGSSYPALYGYYVCTDYGTGNIWLIKSNGSGGWEITAQTSNKLTNVSSYGEAENGELYAVRLSTGTLYRVITSATLPLQLASFTASEQQTQRVIQWTIEQDAVGSRYILESASDPSAVFHVIDQQESKGNGRQHYTSWQPTNADVAYYRLKIINSSGQVTYSSILLFKQADRRSAWFHANRKGDQITVNLLQATDAISVYNITGALLYQTNLHAQMGFVQIPIQQQGLLLIKVISGNKTQTKKVW